MNTYYFQGVRWIPGSRTLGDFDFDDCEITAETAEKAWEELDKMTTLKTWKTVGLITINNQRYYEGV